MNGKEFFKKAGVGLSKALLVGLFTGAVVVAPGGVAGTLQVLGKIFEGKEFRDYDGQQVQRALRYLRSKKLIDIQKKYREEVFLLTTLGRSRIKRILKSFAITRPKKWDGKWRMVVFDIPESKRDKRDVFRQQLRSLGLANLQQSIWIHPYECRDQIYYLAGNLFIKPYVRYIVAQEITGEADLAKRFAINL